MKMYFDPLKDLYVLPTNQQPQTTFRFNNEDRIIFTLKGDLLDIEVIGDMTEQAKLFINHIKELCAGYNEKKE